MSLKWFCELVHVSLPFFFFVYHFWQAFYDDGFLLSVSKHCVYKRNLTDVWRIDFWACHSLWNKCIFAVHLNDSTSLDLCVLLCLCRMAIQVDKFDFDSMPVMDHDALRLATVRQQEEKRQQVQGGLINSTLDIHWTIISFTQASCSDNTVYNKWAKAERIWVLFE